MVSALRNISCFCFTDRTYCFWRRTGKATINGRNHCGIWYRRAVARVMFRQASFPLVSGHFIQPNSLAAWVFEFNIT